MTKHPRMPTTSLSAERRWKRLSALAFGVAAYVVGVRSMLYLAGFVSGVGVPRTIDTVEPWATASVVESLLINAVLLGLFGLSHSVFAREGFKRRLERALPALLERSFYTLLAGVSLTVVMWQWRAVPQPVWKIDAEPLAWGLRALALAGWCTAAWAFRSLGHLDLFGLRQAWRFSRGLAYSAPPLRTEGLYGKVRHPAYVGFLVGCWATPVMSVGHLWFAVVMTMYVLIGLRFEERDLANRYGARYRDYRRRVAGLLSWRR